MGCATCLSGSHAQSPETTLPLSYNLRLERQFQRLKPCSLVSREEIDMLKTAIKNPIFFSKQNMAPKSLSSQDCSIKQQTEDLNIVRRWKLLVFCSGVDLFDEQWQRLNKDRQHKSFRTVQIDLKRTFSTCQCFKANQRSQILENVLKMLAIYFPKIGYTQGLNYLAGYLIMLGFSQKECFWFIVHLALHQKYLILGLFQDHFPLVAIYCQLFKHLFSSRLPVLYSKFTLLGLTDDTWVFKWFLTMYIYSLPMAAIKPIWDFIFVVGTIAEVYLAIALLIHLEKNLPTFEDAIDIVEFFDSIKEQATFSKFINISQWISIASDIQLSLDETSLVIDETTFQGRIEIKKTFYSEYYSQSSLDKKQKIYLNWLQIIRQQRSDYWSIAPAATQSKNTAFYLRKKLKKARLSHLNERVNRVRVNSSSHVQTFMEKPINSDDSEIVQLKQFHFEPHSDNKIFRSSYHYCQSVHQIPHFQKQSVDQISPSERDFIAEFDSVESIRQDSAGIGIKEKSSTDFNTKKSDVDVFNLE